MAAFCGCCGVEIGLKAEACPVCGTPQHGMGPSGPLQAPESVSNSFWKTAEPGAGYIIVSNK